MAKATADDESLGRNGCHDEDGRSRDRGRRRRRADGLRLGHGRGDGDVGIGHGDGNGYGGRQQLWPRRTSSLDLSLCVPFQQSHGRYHAPSSTAKRMHSNHLITQAVEHNQNVTAALCSSLPSTDTRKHPRHVLYC